MEIRYRCEPELEYARKGTTELLSEARRQNLDLQRQLAEAEARAERAEQAAAEAEARGAELRGALMVAWETPEDQMTQEMITKVNAALALPHDGSALAAAVERARSEEREACTAAIEETGRAREALVHDVDHAAARADCCDAIRKRGEG